MARGEPSRAKVSQLDHSPLYVRLCIHGRQCLPTLLLASESVSAVQSCVGTWSWSFSFSDFCFTCQCTPEAGSDGIQRPRAEARPSTRRGNGADGTPWRVGEKW